MICFCFVLLETLSFHFTSFVCIMCSSSPFSSAYVLLYVCTTHNIVVFSRSSLTFHFSSKYRFGSLIHIFFLNLNCLSVLFFLFPLLLLSRGRDFYHTCYTLSGLSVAQHCLADNPIVVGDSSNKLVSKYVTRRGDRCLL